MRRGNDLFLSKLNDFSDRGRVSDERLSFPTLGVAAHRNRLGVEALEVRQVAVGVSGAGELRFRIPLVLEAECRFLRRAEALHLRDEIKRAVNARREPGGCNHLAVVNVALVINRLNVPSRSGEVVNGMT